MQCLFERPFLDVTYLFSCVLQQRSVFGAIPRKYIDIDVVNITVSTLDLYPTKTSRMRKTKTMMPSSHCITSSWFLSINFRYLFSHVSALLAIFNRADTSIFHYNTILKRLLAQKHSLNIWERKGLTVFCLL